MGKKWAELVGFQGTDDGAFVISTKDRDVIGFCVYGGGIIIAGYWQPDPSVGL